MQQEPDSSAAADEICRLAAAIGLDLPQACLPGVVANLALLRDHAAALLAPLPDDA